jgi:membrane-associated phospholipid phosphatase
MSVPRLTKLMLVCAVAFFGLSAAVMEWTWIAAADSAVNASFGPRRVEPLLSVFLWVTALGASPAIAAVCLISSALLWIARLSRLIAPLWIAWLGGQATSWSMKFLVARLRPAFLDVATAISPSFPSAHSMSAMVVYGFLAFLVARHGPPGWLSFLVPTALALLILTVGFSRMFLSLHYASDVLGGFLVGGFWLLSAIALSSGKRRVLL